MKDKAWDVAHDEVQVADLRAALEAERGYVSRTAVRLKMARSQLYTLLARYDLKGFAEGLREAAGATRGADGKVAGRAVAVKSTTPKVAKPPKTRRSKATGQDPT